MYVNILGHLCTQKKWFFVGKIILFWFKSISVVKFVSLKLNGISLFNETIVILFFIKEQFLSAGGNTRTPETEKKTKLEDTNWV